MKIIAKKKKTPPRNKAILTVKKEFWDWKPGFTGEKILQMLIVLMMGQRTAVPPNNPKLRLFILYC